MEICREFSDEIKARLEELNQLREQQIRNIRHHATGRYGILNFRMFRDMIQSDLTLNTINEEIVKTEILGTVKIVVTDAEFENFVL